MVFALNAGFSVQVLAAVIHVFLWILDALVFQVQKVPWVALGTFIIGNDILAVRNLNFDTDSPIGLPLLSEVAIEDVAGLHEKGTLGLPQLVRGQDLVGSFVQKVTVFALPAIDVIITLAVVGLVDVVAVLLVDGLDFLLAANPTDIQIFVLILTALNVDGRNASGILESEIGSALHAGGLGIPVETVLQSDVGFDALAEIVVKLSGAENTVSTFINLNAVLNWILLASLFIRTQDEEVLDVAQHTNIFGSAFQTPLRTLLLVSPVKDE